MADHAPLSPSSASRWLACPGSAVLNENAPRRTSIDAATGTAAHLLAAAKLMSPDTASAIGTMLVVDGFEIVVDQEMEDTTTAYAGYVNSLGGWQRYEQRVTLEWLTPGVWGTADAVALDVVGRRLHVVDLKYGRGVRVPVEGNWQMIVYALAALGPSNWADIEELVLHVYQPRIGNVESWAIKVDDLEPYKARLIEGVNAIRAAMEDPWQYTRAGEWCKFCPQTATCPTLRKHVSDVAVLSFAPAKQLETPALGAILAQADVVDLWIGSVRKEALDRALAGETVAGYKLVPKRAMRQWAVPPERLQGLGVDVMAPPEVMSPAQLEKSVGKGTFATVFAPMVESISGGLTLVPESDRRSGTSPGAHTADKVIKLFTQGGTVTDQT
jgi:hypothetical protein